MTYWYSSGPVAAPFNWMVERVQTEKKKGGGSSWRETARSKRKRDVCVFFASTARRGALTETLCCLFRKIHQAFYPHTKKYHCQTGSMWPLPSLSCRQRMVAKLSCLQSMCTSKSKFTSPGNTNLRMLAFSGAARLQLRFGGNLFKDAFGTGVADLSVINDFREPLIRRQEHACYVSCRTLQQLCVSNTQPCRQEYGFGPLAFRSYPIAQG